MEQSSLMRKYLDIMNEVDAIQIQQAPDISPELRQYRERGTLDTFGGTREPADPAPSGGAARTPRAEPSTTVRPAPRAETDVQFQRGMTQTTREFDPVAHNRLYKEYENDPQYYVTPPRPGEDTFHHANSLAQFVMNKFPQANLDTLTNITRGLSTISARQALKQAGK